MTFCCVLESVADDIDAKALPCPHCEFALESWIHGDIQYEIDSLPALFIRPTAMREVDGVSYFFCHLSKRDDLAGSGGTGGQCSVGECASALRVAVPADAFQLLAQVISSRLGLADRI